MTNKWQGWDGYGMLSKLALTKTEHEKKVKRKGRPITQDAIQRRQQLTEPIDIEALLADNRKLIGKSKPKVNLGFSRPTTKGRPVAKLSNPNYPSIYHDYPVGNPASVFNRAKQGLTYRTSFVVYIKSPESLGNKVMHLYQPNSDDIPTDFDGTLIIHRHPVTSHCNELSACHVVGNCPVAFIGKWKGTGYEVQIG